MNKQYFILFALFILTFAFRSYYAFSEPNLIGLDSYAHYRFAEHIIENNALLKYDDLFYGGRVHTYPPFFHIILAFLGKIFTLLIVSKFLPAIFALFFLFVCYKIFEIEFPNKKFIYISLFLLATFPVLIFKQSTLLTDNLVLVFIALLIYFFTSNKIWLFSLTMFFYSFTHLTVIIFSFFFIILSIIKKKKKFALISFLFFFVLTLFYFPISQNIPMVLTDKIFEFGGISYFFLKEINLGVLFGLIFFIINRPKFKHIYLLLLFPLLFYFFNQLSLDRVLAYSSIPIVYFSVLGFKSVKNKKILNLVLIFVLIFSLISAFLAVRELKWGVMNTKEEEALDYLSNNCDGTVLSYKFGHWISAFKCKVFFDEIYTKDSNKRYKLILDTFNLKDTTEELKKNNISHIIVFDITRQEFTDFINNTNFTLVFNNEEVQIFSID